MRYNTSTSRTTGVEWVTPFAATGGVVISNTGTITLNAAKAFNLNIPLKIENGATLNTSASNYTLTFGGDFINNGTLTANASPIIIADTKSAQNIAGFTTTGLVSMTKTAGTATFTGNVQGGGFTINGTGGTLKLGKGFTHIFSGSWTLTYGIIDGDSSLLKIGGSSTGTGATFIADSSTVEWYAAGAQNLANVTFNNLTLSGSGTKNLGGVTVNKLLLMQGTAVGSNTLTYGPSATLLYQTQSSHPTGSEWVTPFTASGGVVIGDTGTITLGAAKVFDLNVPLTINNGATLSSRTYKLTFGGNFVNNGTFIAGTSQITITNTMDPQSISGFTTTGTVSMTKTAGTATIKGNINGGALTINGVGGTLKLGPGSIDSFSGTWARTDGTLDADSCFLILGGTSNGTRGYFTAGSGTVVWNKAGTQTIPPVSYNNLTLSGSGSKTTTGVTVNGILLMEGTAIASAAPTFGTTATLKYNSTVSHISGAEWATPFYGLGGVIISNTGTITLNSAKIFYASVPLTIDSGATLNTSATNYALTFGGDFINKGTFIANAAPITISYAVNQSIAGFTTTGIVSTTKTGHTATFTGNVLGGALTINGGAGILDLGAGLTHTFTGNITLAAGTLNGGTSIINVNATSTNAWNGAGTVFSAGNGTVNFNGAAQTLSASITTFNNLTFSNSGVKTLTTATCKVNGILSMEGTATASAAPTYGTNATLKYNTTASRPSGVEWITPFSALGGVIIGSSGTITMNAAKVFNAAVPLTILNNASLASNNYQLSLGGDYHNYGGTFSAGSSPIIISNSATLQNIDGFTTTGNVSLTKTTGIVIFTGNIQGNGLITNGTDGILDLGTGLTHIFSGTWTRTGGTINGGSSLLKIGGSVSGTGGTFIAATGTVEWYAAGAQTIAGIVYNNLTLSGSGTKTTTGVTVNGILSMDGTATASNAILYGGSGTLKYNGSAAQTTSGTEFPASNGPANLTISNSNGVSLTFDRTLSANLAINTGAFFKINPGKSLTVLGNTSNSAGNSGLQIKSDATGTGNLIHNTSGVAGTVERYLTGDATHKPMHYISSPLKNASINDIWQTGDYNIYWYDETNTSTNLSNSWVRISGNVTLVNARGYVIVSQYSNRTNNYTGNLTVPSDILNAVGVSYTNSGTATEDGWNLIGNPYPCALDARTFITDNSSSFDSGYAAVYYWNDIDGVKNRNQDYATRNITGGIAANSNPGNTPNSKISVGQAFFVKIHSGIISLSLTASQRTTNDSAQFFIPDPLQMQKMWISVSGPNDLYNETLLGFFDGATTGIDQSYDAYKFSGNSNISLYSLMDGHDYGFAIQALPPITKKTDVKLGIVAGITGNYTFKLKDIENFDPKMIIQLKDLLTGTVTDLRKDSKYTISLNPGEYKSRFLLQFNPEEINGIDGKTISEMVDIYAYGNKIYITGEINKEYPVTITDITGRSAGSFKIKPGSVNEISTEGLTGIYFVSAYTDKGIVTKKVLCNIGK